MKLRRQIGEGMLAIVLGIASAVGLALGLGACVDPPDAPPTVQRSFVIDGRPWHVVESHRTGMVRSHWSQITRDYFTYSGPKSKTALGRMSEALERLKPPPEEDPNKLLAEFRAADSGTILSRPGGRQYEHPGNWGQFAAGRAPEASPVAGAARVSENGADVGCGWPCVAMWWQVRGASRDLVSWGSDVRGGYVIRGTPSAAIMTGCRVLPLRPVWMGLAIDAAVSATAWGVLLIGPGYARRALRRRRGLCESCGYDLRGLGTEAACPECGRGAFVR